MYIHNKNFSWYLVKKSVLDLAMPKGKIICLLKHLKVLFMMCLNIFNEDFFFNFSRYGRRPKCSLTSRVRPPKPKKSQNLQITNYAYS